VNVIIIGGGFAGMVAARALRKNHHVRLIDPKPDFEWIPSAHEILSRSKRPSNLRIPRRKLLAKKRQSHIQAKVLSVDPALRRVETDTAGGFDYDYLLIACGPAPALVPGAAEHALRIRSIDEMIVARDRLRALAKAGQPAVITVVGGGFTGVEAMGEIIREHGDQRHLSFRIIEPSDRLLSDQPRKLGERLEKLARKQEVEVLLSDRVTEVSASAVSLASGRTLPSTLTLWTAGASAPDFLVKAGLITEGHRGITVDAGLKAIGHDRIFVAGDLAEHPDRPARQAGNAIAMGKRAGKNIARAAKLKAPIAYEAEDSGLIVTFGTEGAFLVMPSGVVFENRDLLRAREAAFRSGIGLFDALSRKGGHKRLAKRHRGTPAIAAPGRGRVFGKRHRVWKDLRNMRDDLLSGKAFDGLPF
jgi:NADH dehydrogenase